MPWPVYTERFLATTGLRGDYVYTVPDKMRAIVTFVSFCNYSLTTAGAGFFVHGIRFWSASLPGTQFATSQQCRVVAYEHETLRIFVDHVDATGHMDGYLLADTAGASPPDFVYTPGIVQELPAPAPAPR